MNSLRLVLLVAAASFLAQSAAPADVCAEELFRGRLKTQPKLLRYDEKEDKFHRAYSVLVPPRKELPPGNVAYHGNRLERYRFIGNPNRGGIYAAMDEFNATRNLDPANYRYRHH